MAAARAGASTTPAPPAVPDEERPPSGPSGASGIGVASEDGRYSMRLWFFAQMRYSYPFNSDPQTPEDFDAEPVQSLDVQRVRLKLQGNAFKPWLKYYFEYDFKSDMLDVELTLSRWSWLHLRVGQFKVTYNRERVDSAGKQQFVERSIVNREVTLDRQPGVMVTGHVAEGTPADVWYVAGLFNGNGANASNDDTRPMWVARLQWSPLGRQLSFAQGDLAFHEKPAVSLAVAATGNRSPYTRFSTSGGGELEGFDPGGPGRYDLLQYLQETAFKYRGLSFQQEWHWKEVTDNENGGVTKIQAAYVQAGLFPWAVARALPRPLELAARWAWFDPDRSAPDDAHRELTFAANWYFRGYDNKLTADVSRLELGQPGGPTLKDDRFRFQWVVGF